MFKSSCRIDVEWFPFDEQSCTLVFGSWTYNSEEVVLNWYNNIKAVQLTDYSYSGIWDVIDVPGYLINKKETKESKIVFHVVIRRYVLICGAERIWWFLREKVMKDLFRKTLFYTVILIIPTVLMAFLSMMAFYLPADSAEKISLTINLLLALVVFLLLVSKILPPTSNIPLMGKYLLMAFVLNITTVVVTVVIVNVYFRSAISNEMPNYVRRIFLEFLPRILMMKRPERIPIFNGYFVEEYCASEIFDASEYFAHSYAAYRIT
ncbi:Neurotransmitter-gated ion-channel transmembrane region [Oesophagostomum dentatum]|uniref:Neurotransmitter-gated ion-channel transmembrane region n=1 Tax=Oesophagostomum dentatum TaxID=61180 RepID=A0A0B1TL54_OESDE|nr:Neurotransmitter-gated ion-channel transmembrane region [Oesophagostomum dentatum]